MSQETIAHELGVSFATVNRWEHNKTEPKFKAKADFEKLWQEKRNTVCGTEQK
jgi:DNA-binding transcriptional regulator YiaG